MPLDSLGILSGSAFYGQRLRRVLHRGIEIASLRVRCGKRIDGILVLPPQDAGSFCVFDRLLAVAKCWTRTPRLQPGALL